MEGSNLTKIKIGGREIPLFYSTWELIEIQEAIGCTVGQLRDEVFGIEQDFETDTVKFGMMEDAGKLRKFATLIRVLGNAGLEEEGQEPDLTDRWVLKHMRPGDILKYIQEMTLAINEAMKLEIKEKKDGPVDEILEEENRKKEQGS